MTLQQLEYIAALDAHRRFSAAAEKCNVSQPSLSALIQKLEEELGVQIFDRRRQPVAPTDIGREIIAQARRVLEEAAQLRQIVGEHRETVAGELRVGIIPTLAPYLLPLFLKDFSENNPFVELSVRETTTENLLRKLKAGDLDAGILATPMGDPSLREDVLFHEEFAAYAPREASVLEKQYVLPEDIDPDRLVLLEEGHCLRTQVAALCELQKARSALRNVQYEAGSLETLRRLVEAHSGITILPQLALLDLTEDQMEAVRFFRPPAPSREVSLVSRQVFAKKRLLETLRDSILDALPSFLKEGGERRVLDPLAERRR